MPNRAGETLERKASTVNPELSSGIPSTLLTRAEASTKAKPRPQRRTIFLPVKDFSSRYSEREKPLRRLINRVIKPIPTIAEKIVAIDIISPLLLRFWAI